MSDQRVLTALLRPLVRRLSMMLARGTVAMATATTKLQGLQMRLLAGEVKDGMEHFEAFGFTSNPLPGAEGIAIFFDGDRSHGVVICAADRRYRLKGLQPGEVAIYNADDADPAGCHIVLKRNNVIEVRAKNIDFKATENLRLEGATIKLHASTSYAFDCNGQGQKWNGSSVETWQDNDTPGSHHNHAPPEIP